MPGGRQCISEDEGAGMAGGTGTAQGQGGPALGAVPEAPKLERPVCVPGVGVG